jgi:uncharacterized membrane protein
LKPEPPVEKSLHKRVQNHVINIFFAGLLATLPLVITIVIINFIFNSVDGLLSPLITRLLILSGANLAEGYRIPGLGFIATILLVFGMGLFTRNFLGRQFLQMVEKLLGKIPVFKNVYNGAKQVIDTFSASSSMAFKKVAMIEYPRKGIYTLAFITSVGKGELTRRTGKEMINVYVPTTPNPTSGFFLSLPKEDVVELDMPVEDGFKIVISSGLIIPPEHPAAK